MNKKGKAIVVFGKELPRRISKIGMSACVVVADESLKKKINELGHEFVSIHQYISPGSIYEASAFAEAISRLTLSNGSRISKVFVYEGYELWWIHYNNIFHYFCLPFSQYRKLLEYLSGFEEIYFYRPPFGALFHCYLEAHGSRFTEVADGGFKNFSRLPFGVFIQIIITFLCFPILSMSRPASLVFIGDKFDKDRDYDFRMKFIYNDLRDRKLSFVEFIRSLESWRTVIRNAVKRRRPVIYSEAITFLGRFLSYLTQGHCRAEHELAPILTLRENDPESRFKFNVSIQYIKNVYDDIWAIRIMKFITRAIGIKSAFFAAALERNYHAVMGCKLNSIPTVGILHGVASRNYNVYDFTPGFDGNKSLSVDRYGLWSDWWREYYLKNSKAYEKDQLFVSGPMRPIEHDNGMVSAIEHRSGPIQVLFISEQLGVPGELIPFLKRLIVQKDIVLSIKFRPYRDGYEEWLKENEPSFLKQEKIKILRGNMQEAIKGHEVVVGSHSTAVLESLFQLKVPIFYDTKKWGDYYDLSGFGEGQPCFARTPEELINKIMTARNVSKNVLEMLRDRYFGDPYKNGGRWVVDQLVELGRIDKKA
jgi:hypothetical protein